MMSNPNDRPDPRYPLCAVCADQFHSQDGGMCDECLASLARQDYAVLVERQAHAEELRATRCMDVLRVDGGSWFVCLEPKGHNPQGHIGVGFGSVESADHPWPGQLQTVTVTWQSAEAQQPSNAQAAIVNA